MSKPLRNLILTDEFMKYYNCQQTNVQKKFDYVMNMLMIEKVPSTKFIKHLENTDFYEMRVSVGNNEYRTVLFAIDQDNIVNATQVLLLNSFLKKSSKDYKQNILIAKHIIDKLK
ncbi:MAG: type II toxin-antitoxin system RelE/ParE family toxin [Prevotella sp.]|nr:type II toxin-antitoxin system RelE/ParE family toxin [Candidatus Equicola faecalis]